MTFVVAGYNTIRYDTLHPKAVHVHTGLVYRIVSYRIVSGNDERHPAPLSRLNASGANATVNTYTYLFVCVS